MNYIFCAKPDNDLVRLARKLDLTLLKNFDGMTFRLNKERFLPTKGDRLICWGSSIPELDGVQTLNGLPIPLNTDHDRTFKLYQADIATINYGVVTDSTKAKRYIEQGWVARREGHVSGDDLLGLNGNKAYAVAPRLTFLEEYRIHSFNGKSIKAGIKVPAKGNTVITESEWDPLRVGVAHPWVRSSLGGWTVEYGENFKSNGLLRKMCHASIKATGAKFGSVDMARIGPERYMVISVSLSPSLSDEGVFDRYALHLSRWLEGKGDDKESE